MWIDGGFDKKHIKCSNFARDEVNRLSLKAQDVRDASFFASDDTYITFLNARSLRKHHEDITEDEELMKSKVIGIAETHLNEDEIVNLEGYEGHTVNAGKGKGVAAFSKIIPNNVIKINEKNFSAISLSFENIRIVFTYISKGKKSNEIKSSLISLLQTEIKPTIIIGDMNYHYSKEEHPLKTIFDEMGFCQKVVEATHDEGNILDHIYVSRPELLSDKDFYLKPLYFSDHDAICLRLKKEVLQ